MPEEYLIFVWRKRFKVGYLEAMNTPMQAIYNDFEMLEIENDVKAMHAANNQPVNVT